MRGGKNERVSINGKIVAHTAKAIRFHSDFMDEEVWLPKSQITIAYEDEAEMNSGAARAVVSIPVWLAEKNGIQ